jgi:hypothetical protein
VALFSRSDRTFNLELERAGTELVERVHLDGTPAKRTEFADAAAAFGGYLRRIAELVEEGWQLAVADTDLVRCVASDPALEARIAGDEDLSVYADWLIEHGDPCGELASLRARAEVKPSVELGLAIDELERTRAEELFGLFALLPGRQDLVLHWRRGWIDELEVPAGTSPIFRPRHPSSGNAPLGTLVAAALLAPMARFTRRLSFNRLHTPFVRAVIAMSPRRDRLRSLAMVHPDHAQELLDALPGLEELVMPAGAQTPRGHANVRTLSLGVTTLNTTDLLLGEWPALETLEIRSRFEISAALAQLGDHPLMRTLRRLSIHAPLETPIVRVLRANLPHVTIDAS